MDRDKKIFFFAASDYPMLGMADVIDNLSFVTLYGDGDNCYCPRDIERNHQGSFTNLSNNLLQTNELINFTKSQQKPLALFVMYNDTTIKKAKELGFEFGHVSEELKQKFDHKIKMMDYAIGIEIPVLPHQIIESTKAPDFYEIQKELGNEVIVQHPFGSSGETTFFVDNRKSWDAVIQKYFIPNTQLRVSKYIDCFCLCVDACIVENDVVVGPIMSEINGHPDLTTTENSWCGNQVVQGEMPIDEVENVRIYVRKIGQLMAREGFFGYFSVDFLFDKKMKRAFFSEVNPRVSGGSTVANLTMHFSGVKPLLQYHIEQYLDITGEELESINQDVARIESRHFFSQIIFKNLRNTGVVTKIPKRGIFRVKGGEVLDFEETHFTIPTHDENIIYFTPEAKLGDCIIQDAEIGSLLSLRPLYHASEGELTEIAQIALSKIKSSITIQSES